MILNGFKSVNSEADCSLNLGNVASLPCSLSKLISEIERTSYDIVATEFAQKLKIRICKKAVLMSGFGYAL